MTPKQRRSVGVDLLVVAALLLGLWLWASLGDRPSSAGPEPTTSASSRTAHPRDTSGLPGITLAQLPRDIKLAELPREARTTLAQIDAGGPFPYSRDGVVFQNRERILPRKSSGYYHEYTVPTPGEGDRGARRIITGSAGERYWTADHYDSFSVILLDTTEAR